MNSATHATVAVADGPRARAMILAAGRGERMRPLTDHLPKPMLRVRHKPLMQWSVEALARGGWSDVVVNTAWLQHEITRYFGTSFDSTHIAYSHEGQDFGYALETAGGIVRALPKLGEAFWVLAGDIFTPDFAFSQDAMRRFVSGDKIAHLYLVPNPLHHPAGDFGLAGAHASLESAAQLALNAAPRMYTYSTIGLYRRDLFAAPYCDIPAGNPEGVRARLAPLLRAAIADRQVSAELYTGAWTDVGTPDRLAQLDPQPAGEN